LAQKRPNPEIHLPNAIASEPIFLRNAYKLLKSSDLFIVTARTGKAFFTSAVNGLAGTGVLFEQRLDLAGLDAAYSFERQQFWIEPDKAQPATAQIPVPDRYSVNGTEPFQERICSVIAILLSWLSLRP
jgi:hypothetical protein